VRSHAARRKGKVKDPVVSYVLSMAALAAAVLLRWLLDPLMGDALPLVTLFGAVAVASRLGGYRPAVLVSLLGYVACEYLFIAPRRSLSLGNLGDVLGLANTIGLAAYLFTCAIIIGLGEAARKAQADKTSQLMTARLLASIVESSDDAIISKDLNGNISSWNRGAERVFGYTAQEVVGKPATILMPEDR